VGSIILMALGSAVFPALLACVAIIMSRPRPRRLLFAFYVGGVLTSVTTGILVLRVFRHGHHVLGSSTSAPHPATSIAAGVVALGLSWLMASRRGHDLLARARSRVAHRRGRTPRPAEPGPNWAERKLSGASSTVSFVVGAVINLPGPLYILALGDIATGGYGPTEQIALILLFNAIMFLLLEIPLVGYLLRPDATAARVAAMSRWLNANGLRLMGGLVGVFGVSLVVQGVHALLS
jgi:hypothetical protein